MIWPLVACAAVLQAAAWLLVRLGLLGDGPGVVVQLAVAWITIVTLAAIAARRMDRLSTRVAEHQQAYRLTLGQVAQLEAQNTVLEVIARAPDVTLAFQALARHLTQLVPCDRVGLALLKEGGRQFETFTARVGEDERRRRPRPEPEFSVDHSVIGQVVRDGEPLVLDDLARVTPDYYDANVLRSAGMHSALILPLMSKGRAVGTLNLVSRTAGGFKQADAQILQPIVEILAVAHVAQQAQLALARYRSVEAMSEVTLSVANDIHGALQVIIGHCDLLERSYLDPALQQDLATVIRQAQRIASLIETMRAAAADRLREVAASVSDAGGQG
jgi:transcriptional regulator with GAF, ATPase, and Fis domain